MHGVASVALSRLTLRQCVPITPQTLLHPPHTMPKAANLKVSPHASTDTVSHCLSRRTRLRTELRTVMDDKHGKHVFTPPFNPRALTICKGEAVGDPDAGMCYVIESYAENTVIGHGMKIEGWPSWIPFRNASEIPGGCAVLSELLKLWEEKKIRFVPATALDRLNAALDPTLVAPAPGFVHRKPYGGRDDIGRSRYRPKTKPDGGPLRRPKDGPKSDKVIYDSDGEDGDPQTKAQPPLRLQPLPLLPPFAPGRLE